MTTENNELIQRLQHLRQQAYAANRMHECEAFRNAADALQALQAERDALQAKLTALEKQEPVVWRREWEGDVSDLDSWLYIEDEADKDELPWQSLYPAAGAAQPVSVATPETTAEQFIQAAIDAAPEPLRRLGEYLSRVLDEDQWITAEGMLLGVANAAMPMTNIDAVMEQVQVFASAWSLVGSRFDFGQAVDDAKLAEAELRAMLTTALQPPEPASEKPLPLTTIVTTSMDYRITASTNEIVRFVRAIEQLHNIKGQP